MKAINPRDVLTYGSALTTMSPKNKIPVNAHKLDEYKAKQKLLEKIAV